MAGAEGQYPGHYQARHQAAGQEGRGQEDLRTSVWRGTVEFLIETTQTTGTGIFLTYGTSAMVNTKFAHFHSDLKFFMKKFSLE